MFSKNLEDIEISPELVENIWENVITRLAKEKEKIIEEKKKGIQRSHESESPTSVPEENQDFLVSKKNKLKVSAANQKKTKTKKGKSPVSSESAALSSEPPRDMPENFKEFIVGTLGGTEIKLVIQKPLQKTDLIRSQNRLSMPKKQLSCSTFLNEDEEKSCSIKKGVDVNVFVEPCLKVSKMHLNHWHIGSSSSYILNSQWSEMVEKNAGSLRKDAVIQVWSFRVGPKSELGFALVPVEDAPEAPSV